MLKQRRKAADQVAGGLFEAEAAIDQALNKTAVLAASIPSARAEAGLSAIYGQSAIERLSETLAALTQARRGIVEAHKELAIVQRQVGLGAVAYGDDATKPPASAVHRPDLRTVEPDAAAA